MQNHIKDFDVGVLTSRFGALDSHQILPQDTDAQLVAEGGLAIVLVGYEGISLCCYSLFWDAAVNPINSHETVIENIALLLTVKVDLWWSEAAGAGDVRTGVKKK